MYYMVSMPEERLELSRRCRHGILSPACLPFHHSGFLQGRNLPSLEPPANCLCGLHHSVCRIASRVCRLAGEPCWPAAHGCTNANPGRSLTYRVCTLACPGCEVTRAACKVTSPVCIPTNRVCNRHQLVCRSSFCCGKPYRPVGESTTVRRMLHPWSCRKPCRVCESAGSRSHCATPSRKSARRFCYGPASGGAPPPLGIRRRIRSSTFRWRRSN